VTEVTAGQNVQNSAVVIYGPKLYALRYLLTVFGISSNSQITFSKDPSTVDIEIILGNDWMNRLPAGF